MCAVLELNTRQIRPSKWVGIWRRSKQEQLPWAGFAKAERLAWWKKNGGELVDVPAHRFAERSDRTGQLRWEPVPPGNVVRGIVVESENKKPILKIVTRASTPEELAQFEHPRMPLLELPLFSADPVEVVEPPGAIHQGELF